MKVWTWLLVCAVGIFSASAALAQKVPKQKFEMPSIDTFLPRLDLTEKQQAKVQDLQKQKDARITKATSSKTITPQATDRVKQGAETDYQKKVVNDVLTSDQRKKLKELQTEARKQFDDMNNPKKNK